MVELILMPKRASARSDRNAPRQPLPDLLNQLIADGAEWAASELAMGKLEARQMMRRYAASVAFAILALAFLITALVILFQSLTTVLGQYMNNIILAGILIGLGLLGASVTSVLAARQLLKRGKPPCSLLFKVFHNPIPAKGGRGD